MWYKSFSGWAKSICPRPLMSPRRPAYSPRSLYLRPVLPPSLVTRHYPYSFHSLPHSLAQRSASKSFPINTFLTLCKKHRGWGYPRSGVKVALELNIPSLKASIDATHPQLQGACGVGEEKGLPSRLARLCQNQQGVAH